MEELQGLVYVSSAVAAVSDDQLVHLLTRARVRNIECQVTGLLLFDAGNFMQYIEGPPAGLDKVYDHIRKDPLHTGLIELCRETVPRRAFDGWAMAAKVFDVSTTGKGAFADSEQQQALRLLADANGAAGILLRGFWQRSQRLWQASSSA
jgi:hypothetical protein